jgi:hypothetical protein
MAQDAPPAKPPAPPPAGEWRSLYDGKTLADWKETPFVAKGKVSIQDGSIVLGTGFMTGVNWTKDFPKANYEVRYEAARLQGNDFFGAITFPVHDSYCSLIVGGWGGMLVGLSSLDTMDASENETTTMHLFNQGQWYSFRLQVTDYQIDAWIDDEQVISVSIVGREVSLRPGEIEKSVPLGFASFSATGALRKIEYRLLPADAAP